MYDEDVDYSKAASAVVAECLSLSLAYSNEERLTIEERRTQCARRYYALLKACKPDRSPGQPDERLAVTRLWRDHFEELNTCVVGTGYSFSDVGFLAICASMCREQPDEFGHVNLHWLPQVWTEMAVYSSSHTLEARQAWPSHAQIDGLWSNLAGLVTKHFHLTQKGRALLGEKLGHVKFDPDLFGRRGIEMRSAFEELREPLTMKAFLAAKVAKEKEIEGKRLEQANGEYIKHYRAFMRMDREAKEKDETNQGVAEEERGILWRDNPEGWTDHFVMVASRLLWKLDSDRLLLELYPPHPEAELHFTGRTYDGVRRWVKQKLTMQQPDEITAFFRERAGELCFPLGSETYKLRDPATVNDDVSSFECNKAELGHVSEQLHTLYATHEQSTNPMRWACSANWEAKGPSGNSPLNESLNTASTEKILRVMMMSHPYSFG